MLFFFGESFVRAAGDTIMMRRVRASCVEIVNQRAAASSGFSYTLYMETV